MLTPEQKQEIYELYQDKSNRVVDIAKAYKIDRGNVCRIAKSLGAEGRHKRAGKSSTKAKICPVCRKATDVKGAKYCPYCGSDIRSKKELLIDRISKAMKTTSYLPESCRDEIQKLFVDIKEELSKE